jgi:GNAT superfamily N-acetyltransferase
MNYRLAADSDLPELAGMRWDFRTEIHPIPEGATRDAFIPPCVDFLRDALASGRWLFWIAEENGQIVSQIFVQRIRKMPRPGKLLAEFGYVTNVYTLPAFRGRGIGAVLMAYVKEWAHQEKLDILILWPSQKARPFYHRAGFRPSPEALEYAIWDG